MKRKRAKNLRQCERCERYYLVKTGEEEHRAKERHWSDVVCRGRFTELQVGRIGYVRSLDYTRTLTANGIRVIRIPATPNTGTNTLRIVPFAPVLAVAAARYVDTCNGLRTKRRGDLLWLLIEDDELMRTCDTAMMLGGSHAVSALLDEVGDAIH